MIANPSKYQLDIFDTLLNTNKNIVIQATAGSGKSTTIITGVKLLPLNVQSCFLAFNKSIVEHLKTKLPPNVTCKTAHSFGMTALINHYRINFKLNIFKSLKFIVEQLKHREGLKDKQRNAMQFLFMDTIGLIRMNLTPYTAEAITNLCSYYRLDLDEKDILDCIEILKKIELYNKSFSKTKNDIDFTDMVYLIATNPKIQVPKFDAIFIDECQDLNKAQQLLVERLIKPTGRIIAVGDERQSLYSFAGADGNSFEYFKTRQNTVVLPLSISYRCSKQIVLNAKNIYSEIEVYDKAEEGEVREGSVSEIGINDMVICRNNRPLIELYFKLLERNIPATIIGRDIEVGLNKVLAKIITLDVKSGLKKLEDLQLKLKEDLKAKGIRNPQNHEKYINFSEQMKVIEILSRGLTEMFQVEGRIKELFKERKEDTVRLLTVHGSKGLENDRVFMIEKFEGKRLIPSPYAEQPWEKIQEQNIAFVAATRAKRSFIKISL